MRRTTGWLTALVVALAASACGNAGIGGGPAELEPVPLGPLGPVIARPDGDGPPIECRGIDRETCVGPGSVSDGVAGLDLAAMDRVIVSCIGRCDAQGGEFRIDVVIDGATREIGRGGYGQSTSQ